MTALKGLSTDGKLIGIISHVNELKEEIEKQIIITKDSAGNSHAKINISWECKLFCVNKPVNPYITGFVYTFTQNFGHSLFHKKTGVF